MSSLFTNNISCSCSIPKPAYHPIDTNCIIISTHHNENGTTPGIYKYNIITNKSQIISKYNNTLKPASHGQFIDTSNNTLILYGGRNNTFEIFDLNTKQMKQINGKNMLSKCSGYPQNTFIPSSIHQIHVMDEYFNHYSFNIINKQIKIKTNQNKTPNIYYPKLLYIKSHRKLY
eukprot:141406_1